tara:strand:+ start:41 stop:457 length:417 start_codon:yes stop_codon:yes gene_type:complete
MFTITAASTVDGFDQPTYLSKLTDLIQAGDAAAAEASTEISPVNKRRLEEGPSIAVNYTTPELEDATAAMAALSALVCKGEVACANTSATLGVTVKEAFEPTFTPYDPSNNDKLNTINTDEDIAIAVALSVSRSIDRP